MNSPSDPNLLRFLQPDGESDAHITAEEIVDLIQKKGDGESLRCLQFHLDGCRICQALYADIERELVLEQFEEADHRRSEEAQANRRLWRWLWLLPVAGVASLAIVAIVKTGHELEKYRGQVAGLRQDLRQADLVAKRRLEELKSNLKQERRNHQQGPRPLPKKPSEVVVARASTTPHNHSSKKQILGGLSDRPATDLTMGTREQRYRTPGEAGLKSDEFEYNLLLEPISGTATRLFRNDVTLSWISTSDPEVRWKVEVFLRVKANESKVWEHTFMSTNPTRCDVTVPISATSQQSEREYFWRVTRIDGEYQGVSDLMWFWISSKRAEAAVRSKLKSARNRQEAIIVLLTEGYLDSAAHELEILHDSIRKK